MTVVKQLVKSAIYPAAMGAGVGLCLWVLLGPLRIDRFVVVGQGRLAMPDVTRAPGGASEPDTVDPNDLFLVPGDRLARPSGRIASAMEDLPLGAGDRGPLATRLQGALIKKGYSIGPGGTDGALNDDTLAALLAFQDNHALPVQPTCDQRCWTTLGP